MAAADFNHDGIADLAVINNSGINLLAGRSNGTFALSASFAGSYNDLKVGDFNGDGYTDFAAVYLPNGGPYPINSFINNGAGTFTAHDVGTNTSAPDNTPYVLAAADFNGDGVIDLAGLTSGCPRCNNFTEISNTQNSNYIQRVLIYHLSKVPEVPLPISLRLSLDV